MQSIGNAHLLHFLVELTALTAASRMLAGLAKRLGQATVIGELLGGLLLGPSEFTRYSARLSRA